MIPITQNGLLLKITAYGESDAILQVLGQETGLMTYYARGYKRSKRRFAGLDQFSLAEFVRPIKKKSQSLVPVQSTKVLDSHWQLRTNLPAYSYACYLAELVLKFLAEEDAQPKVFLFLQNALQELSSSTPGKVSARFFEFELLELLGLQMNFQACSFCGGMLRLSSKVWLSYDSGWLCNSCSSPRHDMEQVLLQNEFSVVCSQNEVWPKLLLTKMRKMFLHYFEAQLGKRLMCGTWLKEIQ